MSSKSKKPRRQKHVPQRTCIACRQKFEKRRLTRIVRTPDVGIVIDPTGKQNGRGAYLCDQLACWEKVIDNVHILNKALLADVSEAEKEMIAAHKPVGIERIELT